MPVGGLEANWAVWEVECEVGWRGEALKFSGVVVGDYEVIRSCCSESVYSVQSDLRVRKGLREQMERQFVNTSGNLQQLLLLQGTNFIQWDGCVRRSF